MPHREHTDEMSFDARFEATNIVRVWGKIPSIVTSGRLGNQLFQWAFMHSVISLNSNSEMARFDFIELDVPTNRQKNYLAKLKDYCDHFEISDAPDHLRYRMRLTEKSKIHFKTRISESISNLLHLSYENSSNGKLVSKIKNRTFVGYYQDVRRFEPVLPILKRELLQSIDESRKNILSRLENKNLSDPFQLLHIRGGDYRNAGNEGFGLLSRDFYFRNLDTELRKLIITDDISYAWNLVAKNIPNAVVLNPQDFDEWDALALASLCNDFVGSNSTFAWWCAFLATLNGANAKLPAPFNVEPVDLNSIWISGINFVQADYQEQN
jgi:hypothetical protein